MSSIVSGVYMIYSIKEVSEKLNISAHTLRYYEKEKVILTIPRNKNGVRQYRESDITWLELVNCFKETGMSLADIKQIVNLSSGEDNLEKIGKRKNILIQHRERVLEQIKAMEKNLKKVDRKIDYYNKLDI
jgi:DNA-binding transcriptional MerR regulator